MEWLWFIVLFTLVQSISIFLSLPLSRLQTTHFVAASLNLQSLRNINSQSWACLLLSLSWCCTTEVTVIMQVWLVHLLLPLLAFFLLLRKRGAFKNKPTKWHQLPHNRPQLWRHCHILGILNGNNIIFLSNPYCMEHWIRVLQCTFVKLIEMDMDTIDLKWPLGNNLSKIEISYWNFIRLSLDTIKRLILLQDGIEAFPRPQGGVVWKMIMCKDNF